MQSSVTGPRRPAAWTLEEHYRPLSRYLRFLGCSDTLAEDLVQETFIAVLARPPILHDPGAFPAYIRAVARNKFLKALQKAKSEPVREDLAEADAVWEPVASREGWDAFREAVRGCIEGLDDRDRAILKNYFARENGRREAAAASGLSDEGLKTLLRRIKDRLKACVKGKVSHE
jgi:RNA polymerase sigma-70 factor (ECF subfamily)